MNFEEGERYIVALRNLKDARRQDDRGPAGVPRLPRRHRRPPTPTSRRAAPHIEAALRHARRGRHRARRPLPRLGLHRRERAQPDRARAHHPRRRVRAARRHEPGRPAVQGTAPPFTANPDLPDRRHRRADAGRRATSARPDRAAASRVPCYLEPAGCPPGSRVRHSARTACRSASRATRTLASFICNIPRVAVDGPRSTRPRPSLYGHGLLGSAGEVDRGQRRGDGERAQLRLLRDRLDRHVARRTCRTSLTLLQDLSNFPTLADRVQQGILNFLYLGRLMIHPTASRDPAFQSSGDAGDRHRAPLLRRQQPGRHHRRRAHRGGAGLRPRRARRAGDELLDAAAPQRRLRPVRPRRHRGRSTRRRALRPTRTSSSGR